MRILGILASGPKPYSLLSTFTSSGNWTVPSNITKIAVFLIGGGGIGQSGDDGISSASGKGGNGGGGSPGVAFKDYLVVPGTTYPVTVGFQGSSSFSTIANSGYGMSQGYVPGSSTVPGYISATGGFGGNGGARRTTTGSGLGGTAGASGEALTLDLSGLGNVTVNTGTGGPGGGSGARAIGTTSTTYSGGNFATSGGAISGRGGTARAHTPIAGDATYISYTSYPAGAGGPGGGGGGSAYSTIFGFGDIGFGTPGDIGNGGVVYIYGA